MTKSSFVAGVTFKIFRIQEKPARRSFLLFKISEKLQMFLKIVGTVF